MWWRSRGESFIAPPQLISITSWTIVIGRLSVFRVTILTMCSWWWCLARTHMNPKINPNELTFRIDSRGKTTVSTSTPSSVLLLNGVLLLAQLQSLHLIKLSFLTEYNYLCPEGMAMTMDTMRIVNPHLINRKRSCCAKNSQLITYKQFLITPPKNPI